MAEVTTKVLETKGIVVADVHLRLGSEVGPYLSSDCCNKNTVDQVA